MVDTQSQLRLKRIGPCSVEIRQSFPSNHLLNAECAHRVFRSQHPPAHSCRPLHSREGHDPEHWPAFLLTFGLKQTQDAVMQLHTKERKHKSVEDKPADKLLYSVGQRGQQEGNFAFPRGMSISPDGEVAVADTDNHRVQVLNGAGVFKNFLGRGRGSAPGELLFPCDVAWMPTGNYAVADCGNSRVQIFRPRGNLRMMFLTDRPPVAVACDPAHNLFVANDRRQVQLYRKGGKLQRVFSVGGRPAQSPLSLAASSQLLLVCDTACRCVRGFNYDGQPVLQFEPQPALPGLAVQPVGIDVVNGNQLVIGDAVNHTVSVYSLQGRLLRVALGPADDLGAVQAVRASPEGHLVVSEFAVNGLHCLKIFRFAACRCHDQVSSSSKKDKSTPVPKAHYLSECVVPQ